MKKLVLLLVSLFILSNGLPAQWKKSSLPYGGNIQCVAFDGDNVFAGTYLHGGVFFSSDRGEKWTSRKIDTSNPIVNTLVYYNNTIYAGTSMDGILLSTDYGKTWVKKNNGLTNPIARTIGFNNGKIYTGTSAGLFSSADNGDHWSAIGSSLVQYTITSIAFKDNLIFAGTWDAGMFRSADAGITWTPVNTGLLSPYIRCILIKGENIFVGTAGQGIYLSFNNGDRWYSRTDGMGNTFAESIAASGEQIFVATQTGVFLSVDNGTKWTKKSTGLSDPFVTSIALNGTNIYAGTSGSGFFKSDDSGSNWKSSNAGLSNLSVSSFAATGNSVFAGTDYGGIFVSTDSVANWVAVNNGLTTNYIQSLTALGDKIIAGTVSGGIFVSSDKGVNWRESDTGLTSPQIYSLITVGSNLFIGSNDGVFLSVDGADHWTNVSTGLPKDYAHSLAFSGNQIYACVGFKGVYRSVNNGESWSDINNDQLRTTYIYSLTAKDSSIYAGTAYGVYYSRDIGGHWENVNYGLKSIFINSLTFVGNNVIAGTDSGLFAFDKKDLSWSYYSPDTTQAKSLKADYLNTSIAVLKYTGKYLFAGTNKGVIYRKQIISTSIIDSEFDPIAEKEKIIVYPNPAENFLYFNTVLDNASVSIFDLKGNQRFNKQVSGNMVDISHLDYGLYIIRITISNKILKGKFVKK